VREIYSILADSVSACSAASTDIARFDNHIKAPPSIAGDFSSDMLWERAQTLPKEVPYEIVRSFRLAFKQQLFGSHR
jgi:hypothetical protein